MSATALHLYFGNAILGGLEGLLMARLFGVARKRCVLWMIVANYISAWAAFLFLAPVGAALDIDLASARFWLWTLVIAAWMATLLLQFAFVFSIVPKTPRRFRTTVLCNLAMQTASLAILVAWYSFAGGGAVLRFKLVPLASMHLEPDFLLYCVPTGLDELCVGELDDGHFIQLESLPHQTRIKYLAIESAGTNWNLISVDQHDRIYALLTNLNSRPLASTQPPSAAVETPFFRWPIRHQTALPDGKLLFQLGDDQICVSDPVKKQIALVIRGRGPIVAVEPQRQ